MAKVDKSSHRGGSKKGEHRGGRAPGTPNKKTQALQEKINTEYPGYDPILGMVGISQDPDTPLEIRVACFKEVAKYIYPQRKAVEIDAEATKGINIIVADAKHKKMLEDL